MFNKLEARVLSEYKRSRAAPSTFCTLIKHYFSFIKHYEMICLIIINIQKRWHSHQHAQEHAEQLQNEVIIIIPCITMNYN